MTEEEAKTKWCPHVRVIGIDEEGPGNSWNCEEVKPMGSSCIASGCMAWRWINPDSETPDGYCGLAGRP